MKFCEFLKIMNCYIGEDKAQHDFMYLLFSLITSEPFSDEEMEKEENDSYYSFSELSSSSTSKKVYYGERTLPKPLARFAKSHFYPAALIEKLDNNDEAVRENLCRDYEKHVYSCTPDNVAEKSADLFLKFIEAALIEKDTVETGVITSTESSLETAAVVNSDVEYLTEVSGVCPICGKKLLQRHAKQYIKSYVLTRIFPEDLDENLYLAFQKVGDIKWHYTSPENQIALCTECSLKYVGAPSVEEYKNLLKIKKDLLQGKKLQQEMNNLDIEAEIETIIADIIQIKDFKSLAPLKMDALRISQKIEAENALLLMSITDDVVHYYRYVEELFSQTEAIRTGIFDTIASEFRLAYLKVKTAGYDSQNEIFDNMVNWLLMNLGYDVKNSIAARIVVSFFVQNCEVFDEISK